MSWIDAHNHLHAEALAPFRDELFRGIEDRGVTAVVVNGTREADWDGVEELVAMNTWVCPAFGLHPWHVGARSAEWRERLIEKLDSWPQASVGEIGLDRWKEGYDVQVQAEVFGQQLALAVERQVPVTIHCLRAWGALWDHIREHEVPGRGFLLHAYGGPAEMVEGFVKRGGYFSFSGYFLHERKSRQRDVFRSIPIERLLVETDAPDMLPPSESGASFLQVQGTGEVLNSPLNLELNYRGLAKIRGMDVEELSGQVTENFRRLFGG